MDMLRTFFEKAEKDTSVYFQKTKIWSSGREYREYQGKFPVVYFNFKDMKFDKLSEMLINIKAIIQSEYERLISQIEQSNLTELDRVYVDKVINGTLEEALW
jgi:hypothetical protein